MAWRLDLLDRFRQPERTGGGSGTALFHRLHWVLLGLSAATVFVVVLGSYGLRCFRQSPTNSVFLIRQELAAQGELDAVALGIGLALDRHVEIDGAHDAVAEFLLY